MKPPDWNSYIWQVMGVGFITGSMAITLSWMYLIYLACLGL